MSSSATVPPPVPGRAFTPAEIVRNEALTMREKLDLLHRLKAEVTGERADPGALSFSIGDIDQAIEEVRRNALEGTEQAPSAAMSGRARFDRQHRPIRLPSPLAQAVLLAIGALALALLVLQLTAPHWRDRMVTIRRVPTASTSGARLQSFSPSDGIGRRTPSL